MAAVWWQWYVRVERERDRARVGVCVGERENWYKVAQFDDSTAQFCGYFSWDEAWHIWWHKHTECTTYTVWRSEIGKIKY